MNPYKAEIRLSSFDNMQLCIYVVGYQSLGESIIILFKDKSPENERVFFSIVIDSYKKENLFITKKILENNNVVELDMVFWTHPHKDHTPGIDTIVEDFFSPKMVFHIPKFYFGNIQKDLLKDESQCTESAYCKLTNLFNSKGFNQANYRTIVGEGDVSNHYPIKLLADDGSYKDLIFYYLTPIGYLIDCYSIQGNEISRPNDLSISFVMSLDGYDFYFGGDAENNHLHSIEKGIIRDMRWIKVPHHCSKGARFICDNLGPRFDFAASTVFSSSKLPVEEIQNIYASKGRLFMTQIGDNDLDSEYGVVEFDYSFRSEEILVDIHTYANAKEFVK